MAKKKFKLLLILSSIYSLSSCVTFESENKQSSNNSVSSEISSISSETQSSQLKDETSSSSFDETSFSSIFTSSEKLKFDEQINKIQINKIYKLDVINQTEQQITYLSSNNGIIEVDENGLIYAKSIGTSVISIQAGAYYDSIEIEVLNVENELNLDVESYILGDDKIVTFTNINENNKIVLASNAQIEKINDNQYRILSSTSDLVSFQCINLNEDNIQFSNNISVLLSANSFKITANSSILLKDETTSISSGVSPSYICLNDSNSISISSSIVTALDEGNAYIVGKYNNQYSNIIKISSVLSDPYANVNETSFYNNYQKASDEIDSYFRSKHYLMSGDIEVPSQEPTISAYQPEENGTLIKNTSIKYSINKDIYYDYDSKGNIVNEIYKYGAYTSLEEVASYIYAFCEIPCNYTSKKSGKPSSSSWGKYLRLNHSYFSGDTSKYPYEPSMPENLEEGGQYKYYELDIGTLGTDCDPSYAAKIYNNGKTITRGAARIVYTRLDSSSNTLENLNNGYLFYTYNHYNDFQEYLNYQNGWGKIFGNITGGGTISTYSSSTPPTSYIPVIKKQLFN